MSGSLTPHFPSSIAARALWYTAPGVIEMRPAALPPLTGDLVPVRALYSGISRGTERLISQGRVPVSEYERMRGPGMEGSFPFPVKYGYCWVGERADGRAVFALHPHQTVAHLPEEALCPLPDGLPPRRAILAANMETALNIVWDAGIGPADRVAVIGTGVVGLLVAWLAARLPGAEVLAIDPAPGRAAIAARLGVALAETAPDGWRDSADCVIHTSATEAGLTTALTLAGFEARVVEASWFGDRSPAVPLGGPFHARRLSLISSQVGSVSPTRRARWPHRRRLAAALSLLTDPALDALISHELAFDEAPARLPALLADTPECLAACLCY